ncbi:hypothetical protein ABPG75_013389 [Micractinium tetrahymenae]
MFGDKARAAARRLQQLGEQQRVARKLAGSCVHCTMIGGGTCGHTHHSYSPVTWYTGTKQTGCCKWVVVKSTFIHLCDGQFGTPRPPPPPSPSPPPPSPSLPPPSPSPPPPSPSPPPPSPSPPPPSPSPPPPSPPPPSPSPPPPPRPSPPPPPPRPSPPPPRRASPPPPSPKPPTPHHSWASPPPKPTATRSPPPKTDASGWNDKHRDGDFKGFDGARFDFNGTPGWVELLGSARQAFSLKTQFVPYNDGPVDSVMRAFTFQNGTNTIRVDLLPPGQFDCTHTWRLTVAVNGKQLYVDATLPPGIRVKRLPAGRGKHGRVTIDAGFIRVVIIQRWRGTIGASADFLDVNMELAGRLRLPVTGILAPSYMRALQKAGAGAVAGAAAGGPLFKAQGLGPE